MAYPVFYNELPKRTQLSIAKAIHRKFRSGRAKFWRSPARLRDYFIKQNSDPNNLIAFYNLRRYAHQLQTPVQDRVRSRIRA